MAGKLTPRQEAFALHYSISGNASDAARKAGYTLNAAAEMGHRLIRYDHVYRLVEELRAERMQKVAATAEDTLREISALALAAINSRDPLAPSRLKVKLGALLALAKHHGLLEPPTRAPFDQAAVSDRLREIADRLEESDG